MKTVDFKPNKFNNLLNRTYLLNKEIHLYASLREQLEDDSTIEYYRLYVYVPEINTFGTARAFGVLILSKLSVFDTYEPVVPLQVKLRQWVNKAGRLFNDIEFLNPEAIDEHYMHRVPEFWVNDLKRAIDNFEEYIQGELGL